MGHYDTCSYRSPQGEQVFGVCCDKSAPPAVPEEEENEVCKIKRMRRKEEETLRRKEEEENLRRKEESLATCAAGGVTVEAVLAAANGDVGDGTLSELVLPHAVGVPHPLVDYGGEQEMEPELEEELEALQRTVTTLAGQLAVLAAEAIYRAEMYRDIAALLDQCLAEDGIAWFAGKRFYFGCGGGTASFAVFLREHGFDAEVGRHRRWTIQRP